jgi:hypothetical protein
MMTEKEWLATDSYDLKGGQLLELNLRFYGKRKRQSRLDLIKRLNNTHCPQEREKPIKHLKLTETRLAKILSGEEFNSKIVRAIMSECNDDDRREQDE